MQKPASIINVRVDDRKNVWMTRILINLNKQFLGPTETIFSELIGLWSGLQLFIIQFT